MTPDDTFNALRRTPFEEMFLNLVEYDHSLCPTVGFPTFNLERYFEESQLDHKTSFFVSKFYSNILEENYWTYEDFNAEGQRRFEIYKGTK